MVPRQYRPDRDPYYRRPLPRGVALKRGYLSFMDTVATQLAIEVLTGRRCYPSEEAVAERPGFDSYPLTVAARNLGADGESRQELVEDLARLLRLHRVRPSALIRLAVDPVPAPSPIRVPAVTVEVQWTVVRHEVHSATIHIPADLNSDLIHKVLEEHEGIPRTETATRTIVDWAVRTDDQEAACAA